MSRFKVYPLDCRDVMDLYMEEASVDAIVTDPPYGLEFMGKDWDAPWKVDRRQTFDGTLTDSRPNPYGRSKVRYGSGASYGSAAEQMQFFQAWMESVMTSALRVLKPGGYLLAFGGSRTYHRLACAVEDAGFEVRDQIMWVYGSGFPKSHNGEWGGTALKPSHEPIVVARKPLIGTVEQNWREHGTGALNIDGCRVETTENLNGGAYAKEGGRSESQSLHGGSGMNVAGKTVGTDFVQPAGRWPANLIHDGSDEVLAAFPEAKGQQGPVSTTAPSEKTSNVYGRMKREGEPSADSDNEGAVGFKMKPGARRLDTGSAARFFYCAKASRADRGAENNHPTVKPTDLMRYLCRLVTPPGGVVFDPFTGSGSTGKAAMLEGFRFVGAERESEYAAIAEARIAGVL